MMRAMRLRERRPAEPVDAADLPERPGGSVWCDANHDSLPAPGRDGRGGAPEAGALAAWVRSLHPLTAEHLLDAKLPGVASAQEAYVHVRLSVVPAWASSADVPRPMAGGHRDLRSVLPHRRLDVVIGPDFALTVHASDMEEIDELWGALLRGDEQADAVDFAIYQLLVRASHGYRAVSQGLLDATEHLLERLTDRRARHVLAAIVRLRRRSSQLRTILAGAVDAIGLLAAGAAAQVVREHMRPFFRDLLDDAKRMLAAVDDARANLGEAVEAYTSVQSTEMNRVMQIFTVVAVLFMPATLVASIYGMNFKIPEYHWSFGYAWALGLMGVTTAVLVLWFRGRDFLP